MSGNGAFESTNAPLSSDNGIKLSNCSFLNLLHTDRPTITNPNPYPDFTISDCLFKNISNSNASPFAGAFYCKLNTYYTISGNIFININANKSAIYILGTFSSFIFSNNHFFNISSTKEGGVYLYF
jgi:hypothetical protein